MISRITRRVSRHMHSVYTGKRTGEVAAVLAVVLVISFVATWLVGEIALLVALVVLVALVLVSLSTCLRAIERLGAKTSVDYRQVESLFSIFGAVEPQFPLPPMRRWAASPDFLNKIAEQVLERKPDVVLELGSGVSSLIVAYCLRRNGKGRLISLDHELKYADTTRNTLLQHGLLDRATVIHAPLVDHEIEGVTWSWYETDNLKLDRPIDLLLIDGPPRTTQSLARYPALPLLREHLGVDSVAILDDGLKRDQEKVVKLWHQRFPAMTYDYLDLEKGAFVLSMGGPARASEVESCP